MAIHEIIVPIIAIIGGIVAWLTKAGRNGKESSSQTILKKGDSIVITLWSWKKMRYIKKIIQIDRDGDIDVTQT